MTAPVAAARAGRSALNVIVGDPRSRGDAKVGEPAYRWLTWILPAWFAIQGTLFLVEAARSFYFPGFDAVLYAQAARAALTGADPWAVAISGVYFAGPPPTLLAFLPFAVAPSLAVAWVAIDAAAAVWVLRRLGLPAWWLLWTPILQSVWVGNPDIVIAALLVAGRGPLEGLAAALKVYAVVPLVLRGRWRGLAFAAGFAALSLPLWPAFLTDLGTTTTRLAAQTPGTSSLPLLGLGAIAALSLGRRRAAWLLVPAAWPAMQMHYACLALPVIAETPAAAAILAAGPLGSVAVIAEAIRRFAAGRLSGSARSSSRPMRSSSTSAA